MFAFIQILAVTACAFLCDRATLVAENILLRQQIAALKPRVKRPRLHPLDRWFLALLTDWFKSLYAAVIVVRPETLVRWHRAGWRLLWRRRSRRIPGRPTLDGELPVLIRRLWNENPLWGQKRIAAELRTLGFDVSPRTVAKYRPRGHRRGGQRWSTFLHNHIGQIWACDFLTIISARFEILYVFVILALDRREIVHVGVTANPDASWSAQRIVEAVADAGQAPRFLVRDRDSIYGQDFSARVRGLGVRQLVTPPRSPRANAFAERVAGTLRRGCLDHVIVWDERHAERILQRYVRHYHHRPHRGLRMQPPLGARWLRPCGRRPVIGRPILGGLHHEYGFQPVA